MEIFGDNLALANNVAREVGGGGVILVFVFESVTVNRATGWWRRSKRNTKRMQFFQLKSSDPFHA